MQRDRQTELLAGSKLGTLATLKRDGWPQLSMVSYAYDVDRDEIVASVTNGRAKTANIRRDPRVSLLARSADGWSYAVAEGTAALSAVAQDPHDDAVEKLVAIYRAIGGEHPDWAEYRQAMVQDGRVALTIAVHRVYGLVR
ncbi:MAG TPA: PPOX class F420-dependent oxidoreductase [Dermatophilaceae bacterium]|nr:PPOX class F420-dependent oxidoreductase [Dermatophilaceae bacterium]